MFKKNLEETQALFASIINSSDDAILSKTLQGNITSWNVGAEKIFGYASEEIIGKHISVLIPDHLQNEENEILKRIHVGESIDHYETERIRKDNKIIYVSLTISPVKDGSGNIIGASKIARDITWRKRTEEKLVKNSRLYSFLSAINQSIVHIVDEQKLLDNACTIATNIGKFKMAWIGMLDVNGKLNLVSLQGDKASTGEVKKYFGRDYSIPELSDTPTGMALKTGKYAISNEVQNDPMLRFWKEDYIRNGINANISLPVKKFGKVIGVFGLSSTVENFFDGEEVVLLEEAAEDISFALENFEKSKRYKETEELLIKNEKRFRALIEKSSDMKTLAAQDGKLIYASPSVTSVLGYTLKELLDTSLFDLVHPDDVSAFTEGRNDLLQRQGGFFSFQHRKLHKNGKWIWCEGTVTNMLHEPAIMAMVSNFRDISEKKMAEQVREFDRSSFMALINNTSDLMWSVDTDFNLIASNQPFDDTIKLMTGKIVEKGRNILAIAFSEEQSNVYKLFYERAFTGEAFTEIEHSVSPFEYWSETTFYPIYGGDHIIGTACHSRNISKRKQAEETLIQSEKRLKEAQAIAKMGSWEMDFIRKTDLWSDGLYNLYGIANAGQGSKELFLSFIHPEDRAICVSKVENIITTLINSTFDFRFIKKDGEVRYGYTESRFEFDANNRPIRLYGIVHDVTEIKKVEKERDNILLDLEHRVEARTKELRNKNKNILDSINYAKHIQSGLLCRSIQLSQIFSKSFIFSLPRDIVSGDFFWCYQKRNKKFVAVADCTGHGVPAALMSIIGNNLLNQIIVNEHIENPSEILELLDTRLAEAVKGDRQDVKDGMDIVICVVDTYFNELYFSGAYRPLFISDAVGGITELPAARHSVGGGIQEGNKKFETKRFSILPGQRIYLSSDGYYSQFGGLHGKKLMKSRFVNTLEGFQDYSLEEQKKILLDAFTEWMGTNEQVDDILVVGIELG